MVCYKTFRDRLEKSDQGYSFRTSDSGLTISYGIFAVNIFAGQKTALTEVGLDRLVK